MGDPKPLSMFEAFDAVSIDNCTQAIDHLRELDMLPAEVCRGGGGRGGGEAAIAFQGAGVKGAVDSRRLICRWVTKALLAAVGDFILACSQLPSWVVSCYAMHRKAACPVVRDSPNPYTYTLSPNTFSNPGDGVCLRCNFGACTHQYFVAVTALHFACHLGGLIPFTGGPVVT